jgi:hypothetical protein
MLFTFIVITVYALLVWRMHWLLFPLDRDELHFWPTSLLFSHALLPDLRTLRTYDELNTPLPFVVFGEIQRLTGHGLVLSRYFNLTLSAGLVVIIGCVHGRPTPGSVLAAIGLMLFPYFLGLATHLYTDILAVFLIAAGVLLQLHQRYLWSAVCCVLAISSRQYMVAFPLGIAAYEFMRTVRSSEDWRSYFQATWMLPAMAAASLLGWFVFFGGFGPTDAIARAQISTAVPGRIFVDHGLYSLTCVGVYFCLPEALLFRRPLCAAPDRRPQWRIPLLALTLAAAFVVFPPLGNVDFSVPLTMGYFDIVVRRDLHDGARMALFYVFALWVVARFLTLRNTLPAWLIATNTMTLTRAHISWEKYALPIISVLWLLRAYGTKEIAGAETATRDLLTHNSDAV